MTTINNIEDFLRIVREDEALRSAMRRELLTEELLELPARVAEMSRTQDAMLETQNSILKTQEEFRQEMAEFRQTQEEFRQSMAEFRQEMG